MTFNRDLETEKNFKEKIRASVAAHRMISSGETVLVGVSGGADSVALLYSLIWLTKELKFNIVVAHFNHRLREDADDDEAFVRDLASDLGVECLTGSADVADIVRSEKRSLEEVARECRFDFFAGCAQKYGIRTVALGHNLDDQAETVLMRFFRGAGINGLSGIAPVREFFDRGFRCIRPLLFVSRCEIEAFLKAIKVSFKTDSTNSDVRFTRNKVRHEILPLLEEEFNPNLKAVLASTAEIIRTDYAYIEKMAETESDRMLIRSDEDQIVLNVRMFADADEAVSNNVLRHLYRRLKGDLTRLSYKHLQEVNDMVRNRPNQTVVDLPDSIAITKKDEQLVLYRKNRC